MLLLPLLHRLLRYQSEIAGDVALVEVAVLIEEEGLECRHINAFPAARERSR